jgi:hypothetical protein
MRIIHPATLLMTTFFAFCLIFAQFLYGNVYVVNMHAQLFFGWPITYSVDSRVVGAVKYFSTRALLVDAACWTSFSLGFLVGIELFARRRFRFSLRTIIGFVTVFVVEFSFTDWRDVLSSPRSLCWRLPLQIAIGWTVFVVLMLIVHLAARKGVPNDSHRI